MYPQQQYICPSPHQARMMFGFRRRFPSFAFSSWIFIFGELMTANNQFYPFYQIIQSTKLRREIKDKLKNSEDMVNDVSRWFTIEAKQGIFKLFYQRMKKHQASLQHSISHHYFAVHPLSLLFLKDYSADFTLYFQKNLQIIAKHTASSSGLIRSFVLGDAIHHFRMISDKNLDYQWSLYKHSHKTPGQSEEFIESQRISLKSQWASFLESREGIAQAEVEFRVIKCKLKYLIIIGKSNHDLMEKTLHYLEAKSQAEPEKTPPFIEEEDAKASEKNPELEKEEQIEIKLNEEEREKPLLQQIKQQQKTEAPLTPQQLMTLPDSPIKSEPEVAERKECRDSLIPEEVELKLSQSEMEICEQIEKEVNQYEQQVSQSVKTPPIVPLAVPERLSVSAKDIAVTHSQMLNSQQQEVIAISRKTTKLLAAVIILLLIVSGIALYVFSGPAIAQSPVQAVNQPKGKVVKGNQKQKKQGKKKAKK